MTWLEAAPTYLTAVALVLFLGAPLALALRLRGTAMLAAAVAGSFAIITISAILAPVLGLEWSIFVPIATSFVTAAIIHAFVRPLSAKPDRGVFVSLVQPAVALAVAAILIGTLLRSGIGAPDAISQSYDNVFHLNLVHFILEGKDASPLHMTMSSPDATSQFYPNTWHATAAIIAQLTGSSVELATGALIFVTSCLVWPASIIFFAAPLVGGKLRHMVAIAVVASGFTAFPYMLLSWGVLYPNVLSTALLPTALGFLFAVLRSGQLKHAIAPVSAWVGLAGTLMASAAAHPNALFSFGALGFPLAISLLPAFVRAAPTTSGRIVRSSAVLTPFVAIGILWMKLGTSDNGREFELNPLKATLSALTNAPLIDQRSWFLTILVLGGVLTCLVFKQNRWLIASYCVSLLLYVVSSGLTGPVRTAITGLWYNDAHRLAALIPIAAVPLAALLLSRFTDLIAAGAQASEAFSQFSPTKRTILAATMIALVLVSTAFGLRGTSMNSMVQKLHDLHTIDAHSRLISTNEIKLMEAAKDLLPRDAVIAGNPWNGSALAYLFADREVVFPHLGGSYGKDALRIAGELKYGSPQACAAANRLGVTHVLDMGELYRIGGGANRHLDYPGLTDVAGSPVLTPVLSEGDATLYKLTGCA